MGINQTYKGARFKRDGNLDLVAFRVTAIRQRYFEDLASVIKKGLGVRGRNGARRAIPRVETHERGTKPAVTRGAVALSHSGCELYLK